MLLNGNWLLSCKQKEIENVVIRIPGDVHSALLENNLIPDPYYNTNENVSHWIHLQSWEITRDFTLDSSINPESDEYHSINLTFTYLDTLSTVYINEHEVLKTTNMYRRYSVDIKKYLKLGTNNIRIVFDSAVLEAQRLNETLPNPVPWAEGNNQYPNMNLIRKPQFQSGWDWGPCLVPFGIYDDVKIEPIKTGRILGIKHYSKSDRLVVDIYAEIYKLTDMPIRAKIFDLHFSFLPDKRGKQVFHIDRSIADIPHELWSTWDYGTPKLYPFTVIYDNVVITKQLGFRDLELINEPDKHGRSFQFILNGKPIYCRGGNIIPLDALPARETRERYQEMLLDAKLANMNMIRCWGGGYYMPDYFYEMCDEYGILIWQDLLFACSQYPTTDWFFKEVEGELDDTLLRIQYHPCIALWNGDNEIWTTINWSPGTVHHIDFYRHEYQKLNQFLKKQINTFDPSRTFWLASPSTGEGDYFGDFVNVTKGDSHYWEVWHGDLNFSGYTIVKPRFCSEFGFQSYPSLPVVHIFAPPGTDSIDAPAFKVHQKSANGNAKIKDMIDIYFKQPQSFVDLLYMSQVTQALAIKTAVEYWRLQKEYNTGAIFWQINDCWPVSSWSSIEYKGRWKQLMYHAKNFFEPRSIVLTKDDNEYALFLINDLYDDVEVKYSVKWIDFHGKVLSEDSNTATGKATDATKIWSIAASKFTFSKVDGFYLAEVEFGSKKLRNYMFLDEIKNCNIQEPNLKYTTQKDGNTYKVHVTTENPAFYVHLESEDVRKFSDSSFVLLPDDDKTVTCESDPGNITIYHVR